MRLEAIGKTHPKLMFPGRAGLSLVTVTDRQTCGVTAMYDADDPAQVAWMICAERISPELWLKLAERRQAVIR